LTLADPPFRVDGIVISRGIRVPLCARLRALVLILGLAVLGGACSTSTTNSAHALATTAAAAPGFRFEADTFAFANDVRAHDPDRPDLYANYCFVLARGIRQFFQFARFDPAAPRLDHDGYVERVRRLGTHAPWQPALAREDRVVIPGYANLRDFSRSEADAVKTGLGGRFWTWVHWTNWRVTFPVSGDYETQVAEAIARELRAGRLVQLLVTNWPVREINHTVVAFAYRDTDAERVFDVWDPNEPAAPGVVTFERARQRFWATRVYDTRPGPIRVYRMYYSWFL